MPDSGDQEKSVSSVPRFRDWMPVFFRRFREKLQNYVRYDKIKN